MLTPASTTRQSCWSWGDPHIVPFAGEAVTSTYDDHTLGVRPLVSIAGPTGLSAVSYHCPTTCGAGSNSDWFPCGAASTVALATAIGPHRITVERISQVTVNGTSITLDATRAYVRSGLTISRISAPWDGDTRKPGDQLRIAASGNADAPVLDVWEYATVHSPTGYLINTRVTMSAANANAAEGLCAGESPFQPVGGSPVEDVGAVSTTGLFPTGMRARLESTCRTQAATTSTVGVGVGPIDAASVCRQAGVSLSAAQAECSSLPASINLGCIIDACAVPDIAVSESATIAADLASTPPRAPAGCGETAAPTCAGPAELCEIDPSCVVYGGLGCNAGGKGQLCRFCGFSNAAGETFPACAGTSSAQITQAVTVPAWCPPVCTSNSAERCFYDTTCANGGLTSTLGCNAGGVAPNCRFCGFGSFQPCPAGNSTAESSIAAAAAAQATASLRTDSAGSTETTQLVQTSVLHVSTLDVTIGVRELSTSTLPVLRKGVYELLCGSGVAARETDCQIGVGAAPPLAGRRLQSSTQQFRRLSSSPLELTTAAMLYNRSAFNQALEAALANGVLGDSDVVLQTYSTSLQVRASILIVASGATGDSAVSVAIIDARDALTQSNFSGALTGQIAGLAGEPVASLNVGDLGATVVIFNSDDSQALSDGGTGGIGDDSANVSVGFPTFIVCLILAFVGLALALCFCRTSKKADAVPVIKRLSLDGRSHGMVRLEDAGANGIEIGKRMPEAVVSTDVPVRPAPDRRGSAQIAPGRHQSNLVSSGI